ncbi:MAG: rhodanese-like domain-containing protein [Dehalococcoidia bacterium]
MTRLASLFLASLALTVAIGGCGDDSDGDSSGERVPSGPGEFTRLRPSELASMLGAKDFLLVNVHIPYEGELAGTDLFIPFDQITDQLDKLPQDKSAKLVLYCRSGRMSTEAARDLVGLGYTNVWELGGGMIEWEQSGRAIEERPR